MTEPQQVPPRRTDKLISRAIGEELRRTREGRRLSRAHFVDLLPSGIGDRTLLSYEHGTRHMTVLRLIEVCGALDTAAPSLLAKALQRARIELANLELQVDLRALIDDKSDKFRPLAPWASNKLNKCPEGIVALPPSAVRELADFVGYEHHELADYLARFIPMEVADTGGTGDDQRIQ